MMTIPLCICTDSSPASCLLSSDSLYYVIVLTYGYSYKNIHKYLTTVNEVVQFKINVMLEQHIAQEIIRARSAQQGIMKQKVLLNSTQRNRLIRSMLKRKFNLNAVVARPGEERERVSPSAYGKSGHDFLPFGIKYFLTFIHFKRKLS